ncbi:PX domain containing protein [Trichuris trichiura]|uniref:PX domain containing protein n=1 Tax=Trichuris trichiura TaxID=36087 RepID=A0A077Z160_TRITR|nr:PX domain containing protein [Trichuris trichiura]
MMHVSVPVYRFASDSSGQLYTVYEIHINGAYHCSCRYSTLLRLHELIARIDPERVPEFPPKKIKAFLNERSLAERREALQDYLRVGKPYQLVQRFFLDAQRESCVAASRQLSNQLPVYLFDRTKFTVPCFPGDSTGVVLEASWSQTFLFPILRNKSFYFPAPNTFAHAAVGKKRLIILYSSDHVGYSSSSSVFRVNRIRCWRLSVLDLSFEYLFSNNHLEWITLKSAQSVLISLCLQSMIEEIVGSQAAHGAVSCSLPFVVCAVMKSLCCSYQFLH